jgi:hypothetical protein
MAVHTLKSGEIKFLFKLSLNNFFYYYYYYYYYYLGILNWCMSFKASVFLIEHVKNNIKITFFNDKYQFIRPS